MSIYEHLGIYWLAEGVTGKKETHPCETINTGYPVH